MLEKIIAEQKANADLDSRKSTKLEESEAPAVQTTGLTPTVVTKPHASHGKGDADEKLLGWREILAAIKRPFSIETKRQIARLNELNGGPVPKPGRGKQPIVDKKKWLEWWNGIEDRKQELEQRQLDSEASTVNTYKHGHSAVVVPEISGSIKQKKAKGNER